MTRVRPGKRPRGSLVKHTDGASCRLVEYDTIQRTFTQQLTVKERNHREASLHSVV